MGTLSGGEEEGRQDNTSSRTQIYLGIYIPLLPHTHTHTYSGTFWDVCLPVDTWVLAMPLTTPAPSHKRQKPNKIITDLSHVSQNEDESDPDASELDLGTKIKTPKDVMLEELSLLTNKGSKMFRMRQQRVEKFIVTNENMQNLENLLICPPPVPPKPEAPKEEVVQETGEEEEAVCTHLCIAMGTGHEGQRGADSYHEGLHARTYPHAPRSAPLQELQQDSAALRWLRKGVQDADLRGPRDQHCPRRAGAPALPAGRHPLAPLVQPHAHRLGLQRGQLTHPHGPGQHPL